MITVLWVGAVDIGDIMPWGDNIRVVTIPKPHGSFAEFASLASAFKKNYGSVLKGALVSSGLEDTTDPIILAGYSAGYLLIDPILQESADKIAAVGSFDTLWTGKQSAYVDKPGYAKFAAMSASGEKGMIITSSTFGGEKYISGADTAALLLKDVDLQPIPCISIPTTHCIKAMGAGKLRWYVYDRPNDQANAHSQHRLQIAPVVLPMLAESLGIPNTSKKSSALPIALGVGAGLLGAFIWKTTRQ